LEFLVAHGADLLFYLFAALAVGGALGVVLLRNPMYGAIALLTSFLAMAALFLLRHAEFVAVVQIFVYGGGIMVLFLFVIMLVNLHRLPEPRRFIGQSPLALVVAGALVVLLAFFVAQAALAPAAPDLSSFKAVEGREAGNTQAVAWSLYRDYLLPFEIASVFLLVAMIGAVVLGRRQ
jgi:NADH-quinone oxidoreductase subunit J